MLTITVEPHPLLEIAAFVTSADRITSQLVTPPAVAALTVRGASAPFAASDPVRLAVRDLLRHGGFKPAGRSKPAPEYLTGALAEDRFPRINALVDACNAVSLHTGLPISLVDVDRLSGDLAVRAAPPGTTYVFNPAGQVIDAGGLLCLFDEQGPSGSPVKDAQRTKTSGETRRALSIVWGTRALGPDPAGAPAGSRTAAAARWYRELVGQIEGAGIEDVEIRMRAAG